MKQINLAHIKTIAIVGLSDKRERPSYEVGRYFQSKGYTVIPVNPNIAEWNGLISYPNILSIPKTIQIDIVDIFRKSEYVMHIVEDTIKRGDAQTIWMQEGITNKDAETYAKKHGINVVSNLCLMKYHLHNSTITNIAYKQSNIVPSSRDIS